MVSNREDRKEFSQNSNIFRFKCTKCGKCCSDPKTFINLTYLDILNLIKGLKLKKLEIMRYIGFYTFEGENPEAYMDKMVFSPIATEKGQAYIGLIRDNKSRCIFLDETNTCKIYEYRPKICRSFPFTYLLVDSNGIKSKLELIYTAKGIEYCPGISKKAPLVKKKKILTNITKFLAEISADHKLIISWNEMVENKRIQPLAAKYIQGIIHMDQTIKKTPPISKKKNRRKFVRL
jgi:Fe-S-cluster containining protein